MVADTPVSPPWPDLRTNGSISEMPDDRGERINAGRGRTRWSPRSTAKDVGDETAPQKMMAAPSSSGVCGCPASFAGPWPAAVLTVRRNCRKNQYLPAPQIAVRRRQRSAAAQAPPQVMLKNGGDRQDAKVHIGWQRICRLGRGGGPRGSAFSPARQHDRRLRWTSRGAPAAGHPQSARRWDQ